MLSPLPPRILSSMSAIEGGIPPIADFCFYKRIPAPKYKVSVHSGQLMRRGFPLRAGCTECATRNAAPRNPRLASSVVAPLRYMAVHSSYLRKTLTFDCTASYAVRSLSLTFLKRLEAVSSPALARDHINAATAASGVIGPADMTPSLATETPVSYSSMRTPPLRH